MENLYLKIWAKKLKHRFFSMTCLLMYAPFACASTSGSYAFMSGLNKFKDMVTGPFLLAVSLILVTVSFIMYAFAEMQDSMKRMVVLTFWISMAFSAVNVVILLFGGSGSVF